MCRGKTWFFGLLQPAGLCEALRHHPLRLAGCAGPGWCILEPITGAQTARIDACGRQQMAEEPEESKRKALELFYRAYEHQLRGKLQEAIRSYQLSIAAHPTAEAHTFLGWSYALQRRHDEAIAECHRAIAIDPEFGNPYNDIGAYLIELGRLGEAIPWLEKATRAPRYESPCFPHYNLGRVWEKKGLWPKALQAYEAALCCNADYALAQRSILRLRARLN